MKLMIVSSQAVSATTFFSPLEIGVHFFLELSMLHLMFVFILQKNIEIRCFSLFVNSVLDLSHFINVRSLQGR